jgi:hypothetical protein
LIEWSQEETMPDALKLFLLSLDVFAVATTAKRLFVPDIVPIAWSDEPQKLWAVQAAFLLRAIQYIAAGMTAIILALGLASSFWRRNERACMNGTCKAVTRSIIAAS